MWLRPATASSSAFTGESIADQLSRLTRLIGSAAHTLFRRELGQTMADMSLLTDAEIAAVAGGAITQSVSITISQSSSATVWQYASATNSSGVTTTTTGPGATATALGASASTFASVSLVNVVVVPQGLLPGSYFHR
jgi:hypothetical protein